jgi:glc operon protein GlcG
MASKEISIMHALRITLAAAVALALLGTGVQAEMKPVLSLAEAMKVIDAAVAEAKKNNVGGAIAVVDDGGHLLALGRVDGTFPAASSVATKKARTAATFRRPTSAFEDAVVKSGRVSLVAVDDMTPLQGGVPLLKNGTVVGAVGVSGAASAAQDEEFAKLAAAVVQ